MGSLLPVFQIILPLAYAALVWTFGEIFFRSGEASQRIKRILPFLFITVGLHAFYIGTYTMYTGHCLLATIYELCSLIAFTLVTIYTFVEIRLTREASGTGFLVMIAAFVFQIVSSIFIESDTNLPRAAILKDPVFNIHVTTAIFGYAALTLASIYGALYLLLFRAIRHNEFGAVFEHIPSLDRLERYGIRSTAIGFVFLSISIVLGWILMQRFPAVAGLEHFLFDPKILATLLIWATFGLTLFVRRVIKLEGRKLVLLWMSGFALTIISMTIINAFVTSFHSFM